MIKVRLGSSEELTSPAPPKKTSSSLQKRYHDRSWVENNSSVIDDRVLFIPVRSIPKTRNEDNVMLALNILTLSIIALIPMIKIIPNTWNDKNKILTRIIILNPKSSTGVKLHP